MVDEFDQDQITRVAVGMLQRYHTEDRARAAATDHAMSYDRDTFGRRYWDAVREEIHVCATVDQIAHKYFLKR